MNKHHPPSKAERTVPMERMEQKGRSYLSFPAVVGQGGKPSSAPELGAAHDDWRRGRLGHKQLGGVAVAHLEGTEKTEPESEVLTLP